MSKELEALKIGIPKLKKLYELKVITKEQYDIKVAEILKSI